MQLMVLVTFDLKNATGADYEKAYAGLAGFGLKKVHTGVNGSAEIPTTTVMGYTEGESPEAIVEAVRNTVGGLFAKLNLRSEVFVAVGANGWWASLTT